jgi:hypothetical protein
MYFLKKALLIFLLISAVQVAKAEDGNRVIHVIAFYTAKNDQAHISFVYEANRWFSKISAKNHFTYSATNDWTRLNRDTLTKYQAVIFLDTRPELADQRKAFEEYMRNGGGFIGFHFSAFALTPSDFPQNWDWYHNELLGSGEYKGNTWRPTSVILKVENRKHPVTRHLPKAFKSQPNEWYSWSNNLRENPNIEVLLSIDPSSFPVGTGPKPHEIWHSGDYPVVWTNRNYRMIYINMGHNDIDYENHTNQELSHTFTHKTQNQLIIDALRWVGTKKQLP